MTEVQKITGAELAQKTFFDYFSGDFGELKHARKP
jgi:hypothetical protein